MKLLPAPRTGSAWIAVVGPLTVLALAQPTLSAAQTVTPANLVGSWAQQDSKELGYLFRADSTLLYIGLTPEGEKGSMTGRWHLAGDTLVVSEVSGTVDGQSRPAKMVPRRLLLKEKQLITIRLRRLAGKPDTVMYTRVDSLPTP